MFLFSPQSHNQRWCVHLRTSWPIKKTESLKNVQKNENKELSARTGETGTPVHGWWECKLVQLLWKTVLWFLKTFSIQSPYDPAILLLGVFPREMKTHVHTHKIVYACS